MPNPEGVPEIPPSNTEAELGAKDLKKEEGGLDKKPDPEYVEQFRKIEEDTEGVGPWIGDLAGELRKYRKEIDSHAFTCIVSDDKKARIPTLTLGHVINKIYESKGEKKAPILFIDPHNYIDAMGGRKRSSRSARSGKMAVMREKAKELLNKAGVVNGTVLLVTDFISTRSAVKSFEDIVAQIPGLKLEIVKNESWWANESDKTHFGSGLRASEDKRSLHAQPLFIPIETQDDLDKQLNILRKSGATNSWAFRNAALEMYVKEDPTPQIKKLCVLNRKKDGSHEPLFDKKGLLALSFDKQKRFLELYRKWMMVVPREISSRAVDQLVKWYDSPEAKMSGYELYMLREKEKNRLRGAM